MQILNRILDLMTTHLQAKLIDEVPPDSLSRASIVKKGILTANKNINYIQIAIQGGDHELPDDVDGIMTLEKLPKIAMFYPAREVGGGSIWMRRGVVRVEAFLLHKDITEDSAHEVAYDLLGRVMSEIELVPVFELPEDDFGEKIASQVFVYGNTYFETGGPPSSFIFRGKVLWAVFTERP